MSSDVTFGYCVFPDADVARHVCETLVRERVIACANIFAPHESIYEWQGELKRESECAALLKTTVGRKPALTEKIRMVHPYETPALVFFDVSDGSPDFLHWVSRQSV